MVGLAPLFEGDDKLYAYAIGVVAGTLVQLLMMLPALRRIGFPIGHIRLPRRGDERVKRVLLLMLPVSIGLGLININLLLNSVIGSLRLRRRCRARSTPRSGSTCSRRACSASRSRPCCSRSSPGSPPARDYAGMRATIGTGLRQIALLLIPAGAAMARARRAARAARLRARQVRRGVDRR